jgi:hypothetical protein
VPFHVILLLQGENARDLTPGPIPGHLLTMAAPIAAGMLAQTLYFLVDLYFVAQEIISLVLLHRVMHERLH